MIEITREISIDLSRRNNARVIFARQNDMNSRRLHIKLTDGGAPFFVSIEDQAVINFKRADGESAAFSAEIGRDGHINFTLTLWMLSVVGEAKLSVSLYDRYERKLTSADMIIDVVEALYAGDDISEDVNYSLLTELMSEAAQYKSDELNRKNAENERENSESYRKENESLRILSEQKRNLAETERENAESEREERFAELCGKGGQVTLTVSSWNQGLESKITLDELDENDMANFYPCTVLDRKLLDDHAVFISPITEGKTVTVSAETTPDADINLCYFVIKGSV